MWISLLVLATAIAPINFLPAQADSHFDLGFSTQEDRTGAETLDGAELSGDAYVFVTPSNPEDPNILHVRFYLDGERFSSGQPDRESPFDLVGGDESTAEAWDTSTVSNGEHTITAEINRRRAPNVTVSATFEVDNTTDAPELVVSPESLDFGDVNVGTSSVQTVTVSNDGTASISGLTVTEPVSDEFSIESNDCGPSLAANSSCLVSVEFAPGEGGEFTDTLEISTDNAGSANVALSGIGVAIDVADSALLQITPDSDLTASTFDASAFQVHNTGDTQITELVINLSTALFPRMVFDPVGGAGDNAGKCFTANTSASDDVGLLTDGSGSGDDSCVAPFSDGSADDGYTTLTVGFDGFDPGETFVFSVDVDPHSIDGNTGTGNSGAVNGMELSAATVTTSFSENTWIGQTFKQETSLGGSEAVLNETAPEPLAIDVPALTLTATSFDNGAVAATVTEASQSFDITGEPDSTVRLVQVDTDLNGATIPVLDYEANDSVAVTEHTVTLDSQGSGTVDVTLVDGLNYFVASPTTDATTNASNLIYLELDATADDATLGASPSPVAFGDVVVDTTETETVTLTHEGANGTNSITIESDGITIDGDTEFALANLPAQSVELEPGETTTFDVTYTPTTEATHTATVSVAHNGTNTPLTIDVSGTGVPAMAAQALVQINPGGGIDASSFSAGSFVVQNTGEVEITSVVFDLGTSFFPDVVFDPVGDAGDTTAKCLTIDSGGADTGFVTPGDLCFDPFDDEVEENGYHEMTLEFDDFQPDESMSFSVDVDPTTIKGFDSAGNAGAISGLEMAAATINVTFADGTIASQTFGDGSEGGSAATVPSPVGEAITLGVSGVSLSDGGFSNGAQVATVTDTAQTAVVSGTAGTDVTLIVVDAVIADQPDGGYNDLDPYERNMATSVTYLTGTIGAGGTVEIPFSVSDLAGEYTYLLAAATDTTGVAGPVSVPVYLQLGEAPPVAGDVLYRVNTGGPLVANNDGGPDWSEDTLTDPHPAWVQGGENTFNATSGNGTGEVTTTDGTVPESTPLDVFNIERWDDATEPEMTWSFDVTSGTEVEVRLYLAEIFNGITEDGERVFDVSVDGTVPAAFDDLDPFALAGGSSIGTMVSTQVVSDGAVDLVFLHDVENPAIKAIEIVAAGEEVSETDIPAGGTLTTDTEDDGAQPGDPVETTITMPSVGGPYSGSISESTISQTPPTGFEFFGQQVDITLSPTPADATNPFELEFVLDSSIVPSETVSLFKDGIEVAECLADDTADPDPCVESVSTNGEGDLVIVALSTTGSAWNFGTASVATLEASPASVDFGDVTEGTTSSQDVVFTHTGSSSSPNITVSDIDVTGDTSEFSIAAQPTLPAEIAPGDSITVTVDFTPTTAATTYTGTLSVTHDGDNSPTDVPLTGNGVSAPSGGDVLYRVNTGGPLVANNDGGPDWSEDTLANPHPAWDEGGENVFSATSGSGTGEVTTTDGTVPESTPLGVFNIERWDEEAEPEMAWSFDVTSGTEVEVRLYLAEIFNGITDTGQRVFDVSVDGDVPTAFTGLDPYALAGSQHSVGTMVSTQVVSDGAVDLVFLHGIENPAIKAIEIVVAEPQPGVLGASPTSVDFGNVEVGSSVSETVTFTNLGDIGDPSITVSDISLSGDTTEFAITDEPASLPSLAPGESFTVEVTYGPTATGTHSGSLDVTHDGNNSPTSVGLSGSGGDEVAIDAPPFGKSTAVASGLNNPTSLQFGPDGRLYVSEQDGDIQVFSVTRTAANDYATVLDETISLIKDIPNHDDDGSLNTSVTNRQVTGIYVTGTATNPVLYVSSSDPRIGAGGSGTDLNLDTNSGVISKLTWDGSVWNKVDLVRGLPRSEENHSPNGLQLDESTNTLYLAQGGHTNKGAKSNNFANLPEYAFSASIIAIDLDAIGDTTHDLPTLAGTTEPFGGQDGANQAIMIDSAGDGVQDGPVTVHSPGWRNPYDLVLAQSGKLYVVDNGPNSGWGGVPTNEGTDSCTDTEAGSDTTEKDNLHWVEGPGYYGGHPNVTRGNPDGTDFPGAVPTSLVNSVECDYQVPFSEDGALGVFPASTNGITEYTASNFSGSMQGDLLLVGFDNNLYWAQLNSTGDGVLNLGSSNHPGTLASNVSTNPLDVTAVGDDGPFPGTIWVASHGSNDIIVFEPDDFGGDPGGTCSGTYDDTIDEDGDGYTNADEIDNDTGPCSSGDVPADFDGTVAGDGFLDSNLNDPDDDDDGLVDTSDPFAWDSDNGTASSLPLAFDFSNSSEPGTLLELGFTGLMTNGVDDYLDLCDINDTATSTCGGDNLTAGGAAGVFTIDEVPPGDAHQSTNTQKYGFQFGAMAGTDPFTVHTQILTPFPDGTTPDPFQSAGMFIGTGDQDNYVKLVVSAKGSAGGVELGTEVGGAFSSTHPDVPEVAGSDTTIDLYLSVDPTTGDITGSYSINGAAPEEMGTTSAPLDWFDGPEALAIGVISTSNGADQTTPWSASWNFLEATLDSSSNSGDVLYRVNTGGPLVANIDGGPDWSEDTLANPHPAWVEGGENTFSATSGSGTGEVTTDDGTVPESTPLEVFNIERWDGATAPEMTWSFDVTSGTEVEVRLYLAEIFDGITGAGQRVFDVSVDGTVPAAFTGLDPYALAGDSSIGTMVSTQVVSDGAVDLVFLHGEVDNPAIKAIEIVVAEP